MMHNQQYVHRVLQLSGKEAAADVQFDTSYASRPQGGFEKAKQSFAAVINAQYQAETCAVNSDRKQTQCASKTCAHNNCSKNFPSQQSIASSERHLLLENLNNLDKKKILKIRSITTNASAQIGKALRDFNSKKHQI
ncbi:hypothetical protein DPMN_085202 [Dreissena polymorpha]|uniref:Uncharacterized protein n=1 Tax=Dreissena polymorpha TaxID=45954 RepID=A0A9D3YEL1_DREPO|nr:hypothetical protein DPMN_085202 [Dreissena polymorpha]